MARRETQDFIDRALALAVRNEWADTTISRKLFNGNPYGLGRLIDAMKAGVGGPPHMAVIEAMEELERIAPSKKKPSARMLA